MPNQQSEDLTKRKNFSSEIWVTAKSAPNDISDTTVKLDSRKKTCKGICQFYDASGIKYTTRYKAGQKRCISCQVYMMTDMVKCPCCKTTLRTKPRSKRVWNQLGEIPSL